MPRLRIEANGITSYHLLEGDEATIGRGAQNSIVLADLSASSHHARLLKKGAGWALEDLNSTNGTTLNGQPVLSAPIGPGDALRIGRALITFEEGDAVEALARPSESTRASGFQQSLMQSLVSGPSSFMEGLSSGRNMPMLAIGGDEAERKSDIAVVNVEMGPRSHTQQTMELCRNARRAPRA